MPQTLYDKDFYAWSNQQAKLVKEKKFDELDWENLAEEIEDMGKSEKRELFSRIKIVLIHLLKWKYQPLMRCSGWRGSIDEARDELADLLKDNPSLKNKVTEAILDKYTSAVKRTVNETGFPRDTFPSECEWTTEQILDDEFFPN